MVKVEGDMSASKMVSYIFQDLLQLFDFSKLKYKITDYITWIWLKHKTFKFYSSGKQWQFQEIEFGDMCLDLIEHLA